jgi:WD40-like Beta Propeller Repeat
VSNDESPQRDAQKPSAFLSDAERASNSARFYDFDRFRIDTKRHLLLRNGKPIAIKPKALDLLLLLVRRPGGSSGLTSTSGLNTAPVLSPHRSLLAYASDRAGTSDFDIWVQAIAGGDRFAWRTSS